MKRPWREVICESTIAVIGKKPVMIEFPLFLFVQLLRNLMSTEKSLTISILKVYNWELENSEEIYELSFSSLLTRTPIMQKSIKTHISNNQLVINTSLKITYTAEEAKILLKMCRLTSEGTREVISEFLIDLDLLEEKKVQFLPFEKNDKILEVVCGAASRNSFRDSKIAINAPKMDTFIQEKVDFLKSVNGQSASQSRSDEPKRSFAEKLYSLLQETQRLRRHLRQQKGGIDREEEDEDFIDGVDEGKSESKPEMRQKQLVKSSSENLLRVRRTSNGVLKSYKPNGYLLQNRKTRLNLRNLDILDERAGEDEVVESNEDEVLRSQEVPYPTFNRLAYAGVSQERLS